jgi:lysophospholipase L1-like esterase
MQTPFNTVAEKLLNNVNSKIQILGDSTGQGTSDELITTKHGWVGRLGIKIGTEFDVNVRYLGAPYLGSTAFVGYTIDKMLHTTSRQSAATLTIVNGSMGGARVINLNSWIQNNNLIPDPDVDAVITAVGFNDIPRLGFTSYLPLVQSLVSTIRTRGVTAPIVITSQNRTTGLYSTNYYFGHYSSVANYYVGNPLNLSPAFQKGLAAFPAIWYLDTMQAYPTNILPSLLNQADTLGGLHPNGAGHQAQADWMFGFFSSETLTAPVIATTNLNAVIRGQGFSQTLAAFPLTPTVSWSVTGGELPAGLSLSTTGTISGTPFSVGGSYYFTVRATSSNGFGEKSFAGFIDGNVSPFVVNNYAQFKSRGLGLYYPIVQKVKVSGSFKTVITKNQV